MTSPPPSYIMPGSDIPVIADVSSIFSDDVNASAPSPAVSDAPASVPEEPATEPHGQTFLCTSTAITDQTPFSVHTGNQSATKSYHQQQQQKEATATVTEQQQKETTQSPSETSSSPHDKWEECCAKHCITQPDPAACMGDVGRCTNACGNPPVEIRKATLSAMPQAPSSEPVACLEAPKCPETHPYKDEKCVEKATSSKATSCRLLILSIKGKPVPYGRPGTYDNPSDAIHQQRTEAAHIIPVGASQASMSTIVSMLPAGTELATVGVIKLVEIGLIVYTFSRYATPTLLKLIVAGYFLIMLDFHIRAALNTMSASSPSDMAFEHVGMRHIEAIDADVNGSMIVFHDGGKTQTFETKLASAKCSSDPSHSCAIYKCCTKPSSA